MISLQEAIESVLAAEGPGMAINPDRIIERDYGWVLFPNTSEYIETGDRAKMLIGSGGILVLKADGRQIRFASAFGTEKNLRIYELGYRDHDDWDLVITRIIDERKAAAIICRLRIQYVVPEIQSGDVWRVPQDYSRKQIRRMIRTLPLRLNVGGIYLNWASYEALKTQRCFEYRLEPNAGHRNGIQ